MIYLDTSLVVALLNREDRSPLALDWFAQCRDSLNSSDWLITESHSALGIKQRHHGLSTHARQVPGNSSSGCSRAVLNCARSTAAVFVKLPSCSRIRFWACGGWHWTGPQFRHPRALKAGSGRHDRPGSIAGHADKQCFHPLLVHLLFSYQQQPHRMPGQQVVFRL